MGEPDPAISGLAGLSQIGLEGKVKDLEGNMALV
jgi:hypothetical protein